MAIRFLRGAPALLAAAALCLASSRPGTRADDDFRQAEFPARPAPAWVKMADQGAHTPRLQGMQAPQGVYVQVMAEEPAAVNPISLAFDADGTPLVLEGHAPHVLKALRDEDGDGKYEAATVLMDDLASPASLLVYNGSHYIAAGGRVLSRAKTADGWMTKEIVRGLGGTGPNQASGLAISADGWLFVCVGEGDHHAAGADGTRADVLRTGAIFRCRPDGTELSEFARGFKNPRGGVSFDDAGNMFLLDDDLPGGGKFEGVRLLHAQEAADYGWRLAAGADDGKPDAVRAAAFGEKPGKMPGLLKTGPGSPSGLLVYHGAGFPTAFRGLLIYPDAQRREVRAYRLEREGGTFEVVEQFTLLRWEDDELFRPCQAVQGPDGAIYIVDSRSQKLLDEPGGEAEQADAEQTAAEPGRIYRLTWAGAGEQPAIARRAMDVWNRLGEAKDEELLDRLDGADGELRRHAALLIVRRAQAAELAQRKALRDQLRDMMLNERFRPAARVEAIGAAAQLYDADVQDTFLELLDKDDNVEIRRAAAEALGWAETKQTMTPDVLEILGDYARDDPHPAVRRAAALALGRACHLVDQGPDYAAIFLRNALQEEFATPSGDAFQRDGLLRGYERTGEIGATLLAGHLARPGEAFPPHEFAVEFLERYRTRAGAVALDSVLSGDLRHLSAGQVQRLIEAYPNIQLDPPIRTDALAEFLRKADDAPPAGQVAGLETLAAVGGAKPDAVLELTERLVAAFNAKKFAPELRSRAIAALEAHASGDVSGKVKNLLDELRSGGP